MQSSSQAPSGCLVLVVGPSGAGKDTLIEAARERLGSDARFCFPRRVITRSDGTHERHDTHSDSDFAAMAANGRFLLHWRAHGHRYGIPVDAADALNEGRLVVVNVSRTVIAQVRSTQTYVRIIHVTADTNALRARLTARGRENADGVAARLERADEITIPGTCPCDEVRNNDSVEDAVDRFVGLLEHYAASGRRE